MLANHPTLDLSGGIKLLDLLAKIYLGNFNFSKVTQNSIVIIISRFLEEPQMKAYINKFIKITLGLYYATEKKIIMKMGTLFGKIASTDQMKKDRE